MFKLSKLQRKSHEESIENNPEVPKRYPFTQWYTFGMHLYKRADEDPTVEFVEEKTGKRKTIVDEKGRIVGFPGIEKGSWMNALESERRLEPVIRFRTEFECCKGNGYMMIWQVQPDGGYWEDEDGFGMEPDEEVRLYALLDEKGDFTGPFRIYNVGIHKYYEETQK